MNERKLKKLFDFQRFEKSEKLGKLIAETEGRYATELSDDDLARVSAAGSPVDPTKNPAFDEAGVVNAPNHQASSEKSGHEQSIEMSQEPLCDTFQTFLLETRGTVTLLQEEYEKEYQKYLNWLQGRK